MPRFDAGDKVPISQDHAKVVEDDASAGLLA
jgi:hypothetical protein